jgi:hypothetical protein
LESERCPHRSPDGKPQKQRQHEKPLGWSAGLIQCQAERQQHEQDDGLAATSRHQLVGRPLFRWNRLDAEKKPWSRRGRLFVVEHIRAVGPGARRKDSEPDAGSGSEQLRQTPATVRNRRVSPDQHRGDSRATIVRVAPRLEHDVISTGARGDRVTIASRWQSVAAGPRPWIAPLIKHYGAHLGSAVRHQAVQDLKSRSLVVKWAVGGGCCQPLSPM